MESFYTEQELARLGLAGYDRDGRISRKASLYGAENIYAGNHICIDDDLQGRCAV